MNWPKVILGDLVESVSKWNPKASPSAPPFTYIDLSSIDKERKLIHKVTIVHPSEAPSRARQLVQENDVLVSTVRPNLNGVALIGPEYDGATASTGYCVLRPIPEKILPTFLFHWVKTSHFIREMTRSSTGANYPAVSEKAVKQHLISLPPIDEQKRIAAILDKADEINNSSISAVNLRNNLIVSTFLEMFGDPVINPKQWEIVSMKDVTEKIGSGATPRGGKGSYVQDGISLIRSMNIHDDRFVAKDLAKITDEQANLLNNVIVNEEDVLLNITGASVCRCAIVPSQILPARVNQHVCILRPKTTIIKSEYLLHCLISTNYKRMLFQLSGGGGATREALTKEQIKHLQIPIPPIEIQNKFTQYIDILEKIPNSNELLSNNSLSITQELLT